MLRVVPEKFHLGRPSMQQNEKKFSEDGRQKIMITRTFHLPVNLLILAYTEPKLVEQWMGNKVLKM